MEQQVAACSLDREGLVEIGRTGRIERHERHRGAVDMVGDWLGRGGFGGGGDRRREIGGERILLAKRGEPVGERVRGIGHGFHRDGLAGLCGRA